MDFLEKLFEAAIINENKYAEVQILLCENEYRKGDKAALFKLIVLCSRYQAVIPDWATDELIKLECELKSGEIKDFNSAFGKLIDVRARKLFARLDNRELQIAAAMIKARKRHDEQSSYSSEYMFDQVAEELGVGRRDVQKIYNANKTFFEKVQIGDEFNNHCLVKVPIELPVRRGRKMFKD